jgi:hypothetical protein
VNAGRVDKDDLAVITSNDALDSMPCSLRLVGNGSDLLADQPIQKRGFTGIWTADQGDVAAAEIVIGNLIESIRNSGK